jgi:tRNA A-37 threonylcarbamoyl transferase component Bud32
MSESPSAQNLTPSVLDLEGEPLHVERVLRNLPGKRLVCAGRWRDQAVVAKIYSDPRRHAIHAEREAAGAGALTAQGIAAPRLLHRLAQSDRDVLIFERIDPAQSALERWEASADAPARREVLRTLVQTVAAMHNAGLLQEDMHLGNFIFGPDRLYTVDGAEIRRMRGPVPLKAALDNLGLLFAQLLPHNDPHADRLYKEYAGARGWTPTPQDTAALRNAIARRREGRKRDYLRKVFRASSAFAAHKDARSYWICDRRDDSPAMREFLADPDRGLETARNLKAGNTATVSVVEIDGRSLLVKRYNLKNRLHALLRAPRATRAAHSWRNAHRLLFYGLPTPRPIALVEKRWGPLRRVGYFVSEYVEGMGSRHYLRREDLSAAEKEQVLARLGYVFDAMAAAGIAHGDTKASNFLVAGATVNIIDLDAMTQPRNAARAAKAQHADRVRFLRNWQDLSDVQMHFARRFGMAKRKTR